MSALRLDSHGETLCRLYPKKEAGKIPAKHRDVLVEVCDAGGVTPRAMPADTDLAGRFDAAPAADEWEDIRTCYVDFDEQHVRYKPWRKVFAEAVMDRSRDCPLAGASGILHLARRFEEAGGDPWLWYDIFCREKKVSKKGITR